MQLRKIIFLIVVAVLFIENIPYIHASAASNENERNYTIILQRMYLSGDATEEIIMIKNQSQNELIKQYKDWTLIYKDDEQSVFLKKVDDVSPFMKEHGFFGITDDGFFHLYEISLKRKKVIQSFFHVDTKKLEASNRRRFKEGVRVVSKNQYVEVIQEMEQYRK